MSKQQVSDRVKEMRTGNASKREEIDLSMRKREYWETKPSPQRPWHWTPEQFSAFLVEHSYPANTYKDRMRGHQAAICEALVKGEYVPLAVLETKEGRCAVDDAEMHILADFQNGIAVEAAKEAKARFASAIGYFTSVQAFKAEKTKLVLLAIEAAAKGMQAPIDFPLWPQSIWAVKIEGKTQRLDFTQFHPSSHFGHLFSIPWGEVEEIVRELLSQEKTKLNDAWWLMGSFWVPFTRVAHCSSV